MRHWNKDKKTREAHWHRVMLPKTALRYPLQWLKVELQQRANNRRFYIGDNYVEFESGQDATWFSLKGY